MSKPLTAILGCGPSGLLAAQALDYYGVPFAIISDKKKSVLGGAQFSHIAIPGLTTESDAELTYRVRGDAETYQRKVYGSSDVPFVSFENVKDGMVVPAWNLRGMYDRLWDRFSERIIDYKFTRDAVPQFVAGFDIVFSSVPAPLICMGSPTDSHWFRQVAIRIFNGSVAAPGWLAEGRDDNTIVYDGTEEVSWYRQSQIFGVGSTEWGIESRMPPMDTRTVNKPIATNCDCHEGVTRIGRYGTWTKGVLTFHAYNKVIDVLAGWGIEV